MAIDNSAALTQGGYPSGATPKCEHDMAATASKGSVMFREYGTHKSIYPGYPWGSGHIRISDQATIDALREAFEKAGWEIEDVAG